MNSMALAAGLALIGGSLTFVVIRALISARNKRRRAMRLNNDPMDRWIKSVEGRIKRVNSRADGRKFLVFAALLSVLGFAAGIRVFENFTAAAFLAVTLFFLPDQALHFLLERKRNKVTGQLITAIRIFTASFIAMSSVERGFAEVGSRVPNPIGRIFRQAANDLAVGVNPDSVFSTMLSKIGTEHGQMFILTLRQAQHDASVSQLFGELANKLEEHLELSRQNSAALVLDRAVSFFIVLMPIFAYMAMRSAVPETKEFVTQTFPGRLLITGAFLSLLQWGLLDRIVGKTSV